MLKDLFSPLDSLISPLPDATGHHKDIDALGALSHEAKNRLPTDIRRSLGSKNWSVIPREQREVYRYRRDCQFWIIIKGSWYRVSFSEYAIASDGLAFAPYYPKKKPSFAKPALTNSINPSHQIWLNNFFTHTSDYCYKAIPTVFISSPDHKAPVFLEDSPHTYKHFEEHRVQAGDTAEAIAQHYTGVADPKRVYGYNPGTSASRALEVGDRLRLATGWEVRIQGSASNTSQVTLNWLGPVSGTQVIEVPTQPRDQLYFWQTQIHLPPGEYLMTASADTANYQQSFFVEAVKEVQFGVFFDGTGNNYDVDKLCTDDDYEPTNIAKLFELYPQADAQGIGKVYIKGVGTREATLDCSAEEQDAEYSNLEMAFGLNVNTKIEEALNDFKEFLERNTEQTKRNNIVFDVFGFSRGAATARAFINRLHRMKKMPLNGVWSQSTQIKIRFCGLFDTVGSIGLPGDEDNLGFNLNLDYTSATHVYQLAAYHEYREYFPLTSLYTANGKLPSPYFKEETLWGAHSDIGGGYGGEHIERTLYLEKLSISWLTDEVKNKQMATVHARLAHWQQQKAYLGGAVTLEKSAVSIQGRQSLEQTIYIVWKRRVKKQLAYIALEKMHSKALACFVPLPPLSKLESKKLDYRIPEKLRTLHQKASQGDNDSLNELERDYIHHSHSLITPMDSLVNANKPESKPVNVAPNGKREIFYNHHKKAIT